MLNVALVDDDSKKQAQLTRLIYGALPGQIGCVKHYVNATDFLDSIATLCFDLLILDLNIPYRLGGDANPQHALRLLEDIQSGKYTNSPVMVIGVTGLQDVYREYIVKFSNRLLSLIDFTSSSRDWEIAIQNQIRAIHGFKLRIFSSPESRISCDILFLAALADPELLQIKSIGNQWGECHRDTDQNNIYKGSILHGGKQYSAIAANTPQIGMAPTAVLTTRMLLRYNPKCVVMTGMCAGIDGRVKIGDCLIAEDSWDYESGKWVETDGNNVFQPDARGIPIEPRTRSIAELVGLDSAALATIRSQWHGEAPGDAIKVHLGPIGSGAAVVQNNAQIEKVKSQKRKVIGIDMEIYGFMHAMQQLDGHRPPHFAVKGVSDLANCMKENRFQKYASYISAFVAIEIAVRLMKKESIGI